MQTFNNQVIEQVYVGFDGSAQAKQTLLEAAQLAKANQLPLNIITVIDARNYQHDYHQLVKGVQLADERLDKAAAEISGLEITTQAVVADVKEVFQKLLNDPRNLVLVSQSNQCENCPTHIGSLAKHLYSTKQPNLQLVATL